MGEVIYANFGKQEEPEAFKWVGSMVETFLGVGLLTDIDGNMAYVRMGMGKPLAMHISLIENLAQ